MIMNILESLSFFSACEAYPSYRKGFQIIY